MFKTGLISIQVARVFTVSEFIFPFDFCNTSTVLLCVVAPKKSFVY